MKSLTTQLFPPVLDTSTNDIIMDFFNPALAVSVRYDRGVGFFSAFWLRLAAKGMTEFAALPDNVFVVLLCKLGQQCARGEFSALEFCGNMGSVPHFFNMKKVKCFNLLR